MDHKQDSNNPERQLTGDIIYDLDDSPSSERIAELVGSLVNWNESVAPPESHKRLAVFAHIDGKLVGGASGYTHWGWLFIGHLWVEDDLRRLGVGVNLMTRIEAAAISRSVEWSHLDTYDFQALDFYQALGYSQFGHLDDFPVGHTRYFLKKKL